MKCPICDSYAVEEIIIYEKVSYKHISKDLPLHLLRCIDCDEEFADARCTSINKRDMEEFVEEVESGIDYYAKAMDQLYDRGTNVKKELELFVEYLRRNENTELE